MGEKDNYFKSLLFISVMGVWNVMGCDSLKRGFSFVVWIGIFEVLLLIK